MNNLRDKDSDKKWLYLLKQSDVKAFDVIYWKYNAWIYNFIHSCLFDTAVSEDLTQTVFLKIWEKRRVIDPELNFESYLFTIARHLVYKETENRLASAEIMGELNWQIPDPSPSTEEIAETNSLYTYILEIAGTLPPARKEIYLLSREHHLTNKEIAAKLDISEKTVEAQLSKALRLIREKLTVDKGLFFILISLIS
ncbi:MAG: sigma-70 family RNA polymerase sigma factor [Tannerellaceae bacterium]|nr:sigma-70 family RNA polymerase sigma factor [Tannerellaceae bacterium]